MQTVNFKVSELNNEYMEKTILQKLKGLDGGLDVSVDRKAEKSIYLGSRSGRW